WRRQVPVPRDVVKVQEAGSGVPQAHAGPASSSHATSSSNASSFAWMTAVSPVAAPQPPPASALVNAAENLVLQAPSLVVSGEVAFAIPFASTPRRHDPSLLAAFSLPPWHLLGGLTASSFVTSSANRSTLLSIVLASPVVAQVPNSAFVNAAENLVSHPITFVVSTGAALA